MPEHAPSSSSSSATPSLHESFVRVTLAPDGRPLRAAARGRIAQSASKIWSTIYDVERFADFLPMVSRARKAGDRVTFELKFRVAFFAVGFEFTTAATYEAGKWLALDWTSGEPRGIKMRFAITPIEGESACVVETEAEFDVQSLGWLVKFFLKNHGEIEHGIFPGITLTLLDSIRRATAA